jgi:4'-phosphopantetheinyl transferase
MLTSLATKQIAAAEVSHALENNVVHVWRIPVALGAGQASDFRRLLTPTEQARAGRFSRDEDRLRFELGRAATRCLLARYLELTPTQVGIDPDAFGKLRLNAPTAADNRMIHFNLSHSGSWILAAFARSFAVGIDVEVVRAQSVSADLVDYVMSDNETRIWRTLPQQRQNAAFFKCWTSKEAFVKGIGVGLSVPLQAIEVSVDPDQPAQLLAAPPQLRPGDWQLRTLGFSESYTATLAVAAQSAQIVDINVAGWRDITARSPLT